ncbi:TlpA family protein disulfide reductase [Neolewinella agarilytica]|uniref:Thiol-disulfide isomerase or thioredoxin n=1 Tax=Neolewinella agarilytica TaxID=478744 RepID=A0A1H9AVC1_9BACT|nr:TlpA disulfide reductase family protein [Neolewinella agarilytica]SEP80724.1 Thiol-disulfide isomerase or thioredoxin [Neolewinella agarilytica]
MRFLYLLVCILLYVGNSFAQTSTTMPSPHHPEFNDYYLNPENRATITGKVLNLPDSVDREKLIGYAAVAMSSEDQEQLTASVAKDGTFYIELPQSVPLQEVWFWMGKQFYSALNVRSTVHVEMDYAALAADDGAQWTHPAVVFSGPDAELCMTRGKQIATENTSGIDFISIMMDRKSSTLQKLSKLDSIHTLLIALDDEVLEGRSQETSAIVRNERMTEYLSQMSVLYWNEPMPDDLLQKYLSHSPLAVSNRSRDFYSHFTMSQLMESRRAVAKELDITNMEAFNHPLSIEKFLVKIDNDYSPTRADLMKIYPEAKDPILHTSMLKTTLATMTVPWSKASVARRLAALQAEVDQLAKSLSGKVTIIDKKELGKALGHLEFEADLYKSNATSGQELLDQVRGGFPGKAIYLDLWAVWCAPCIQQLPFSKKAHEAAGDLPIEFVYLCTESGGNEEQWQNLIAGHQVPGTHLFVPEAPHNELLKLLLGRGYPTYVLIKPDGTVVHDVPRPSELDREKLERLLEGE